MKCRTSIKLKNYSLSCSFTAMSFHTNRDRCSPHMPKEIHTLRDRPFNLQGGLWFFISFIISFPDNTRVRIFIAFVAQSAIFFLQNLTLGYMTKTLNQIFFSSTKIRIFFSATFGIRIFFRKKPYPPPPFQVKWSFPYVCVLS